MTQRRLIERLFFVAIAAFVAGLVLMSASKLLRQIHDAQSADDPAARAAAGDIGQMMRQPEPRVSRNF